VRASMNGQCGEVVVLGPVTRQADTLCVTHAGMSSHKTQQSSVQKMLLFVKFSNANVSTLIFLSGRVTPPILRVVRERAFSHLDPSPTSTKSNHTTRGSALPPPFLQNMLAMFFTFGYPIASCPTPKSPMVPSDAREHKQCARNKRKRPPAPAKDARLGIEPGPLSACMYKRNRPRTPLAEMLQYDPTVNVP
jgi:hypothetical protein